MRRLSHLLPNHVSGRGGVESRITLPPGRGGVGPGESYAPRRFSSLPSIASALTGLTSTPPAVGAQQVKRRGSCPREDHRRAAPEIVWQSWGGVGPRHVRRVSREGDEGSVSAYGCHVCVAKEGK